jgi:HEAT repeat protein
MRRVDDPLLRLTHALRRQETAVAAVHGLRMHDHPAAIEGLVELLDDPPSARAAVAALEALAERDSPLVVGALCQALGSPYAPVRLGAVEALHRRHVAQLDAVIPLLRADPSWLVRRGAVRAVANAGEPARWHVLIAADDPHWRVRHALIGVLLDWCMTVAGRREVDEHLARLPANVRSDGVRAYLAHRTGGGFQETGRPAGAASSRLRAVPFWDDDVAVLVRHLEQMGPAGRRQHIDTMPALLTHADERVRHLARDALSRDGQPAQLARALELLDEPRYGAGDTLSELLRALDLDRTGELARLVLSQEGSLPAALAWAIDQVGEAIDPSDAEKILDRVLEPLPQPAVVRCALARFHARWQHPRRDAFLMQLLHDVDPLVQCNALRSVAQTCTPLGPATLVSLLESPSAELRAGALGVALACGVDFRSLEPLFYDNDCRVRLRLAEQLAQRNDGRRARLQTDPHPHVRAAALTPERAAELLDDPNRETSWYVLARAARLCKVSLWRLEPEPLWQPETAAPAVVQPLVMGWPAPALARPLGKTGAMVSALGISGHYGLPVDGFRRAVEAGVNLLFWEPSYATLTEFAGCLAPVDRRALHFIAGTFEADARRVERDAERALRQLKIEQLTLFLMFWVQGWNRITPEVRAALERLKHSGKIGSFSLSTHNRPLAIEAMASGWDPVMVRHSAAHRGAEQEVLPRAAALGTGIITFNNTCYGRLLQAHGATPPRAADCYRYTLAQPGVTVCLSAPATLGKLDENLTVLSEPQLQPECRQRLLEHGQRVYEEDTLFRRWVRGR